MNRLRFALFGLFLLAISTHAAPDRPNILWITAEDMSPTLGCYGDSYAHTPNLDAFARESVRYTRAFATAPVCSPSRSTLITGCYAPSLGTQNMRSAFPIPDDMRGFPALLRGAGYYASNNVKTDYNNANWREIIAASWDESSAKAHWRGRTDKGRPFFCVFNLMTSHQSRTMVWPRERFFAEVQSRLAPDEIHDPAKAPLPPYYVDTPVVRRTVARFYDCVTVMDNEVGAILKQLEQDGLAEDTIVFFYSDHGSGMPRHKRALLDSGMHVPLMTRFPENYRHLAPAGPGATIDRLVSFVDFGPTALSLAGIKPSGDMQGVPFLGTHAGAPRSHVFGHRDRVDEVSDLARSVRGPRFLYIRNYMPHLGYNQPTAWPDLGEIRHEFYRLTDRARMTDAQWRFAGPRRPVEELYDCANDPLNLTNLAASPEHRARLEQMRKTLAGHLASTRDVGFLPESEAWRRFGGTPAWQAARNDENALRKRRAAAGSVGFGGESVFLRNLSDTDPATRYWGALGLAAGDKISTKAHRRLVSALADDSAAVRVEAANALARHGGLDAALPTLVQELSNPDLNVVLHAARTVQLLGAPAKAAVSEMKKTLARAEKIRPPDTPPTVVQSGEQDLAMFVAFAAKAFVTDLGRKQ